MSAMPEVQLLCNGSYHVMITSAGGGYSRWRDLAVTRWREAAWPRPQHIDPEALHNDTVLSGGAGAVIRRRQCRIVMT